jgi:ABC-type multidrug transport system ATPase subunit
MRVRVRLDLPGGSSNLDVVGESVRLGRDPDCEIAIDPVNFPKVSGIHARIDSTPNGYVLVHLSRNNKTLVNDSPIDGIVPIRAGDVVRLGFTGPTIAILQVEASVASRFDETLQTNERQLASFRDTRGLRFEIGGGGVIGRDAGVVRYHLDHAHVSRLHASLALAGGRVILADLGSSNGTFVNGRRLSRPETLSPGDRIDIGPFSLQFDGVGLVSRSRSNNIELVAYGLRRTVLDRASGKPLSLLNNVGIVVRPREFVCLLGPSGSGKTTLLAILSGRTPPDAGMVRINGEDLYANFEAIKQDIALVPQKDLLHESLALGTALRYTAELRLPPDMTKVEVEAQVTNILDVVDLTKRRHALIRNLSGGQVKRASLANELVARPSLLFLDEVTSGLDEQTDRDVMELFRHVADSGKTVVCITHSLANVEATCHLVVVLTEGGWLAFVGTPEEAKTHFEIPRLGEVYRKLAGRRPEEWYEQFRSTPYFRRYVTDRLPSAPEKKPVTSGARGGPGASIIRQAHVLTRRYVAIWRGDRSALLAMLGQCLVVAVLLGLVFGDLAAISRPEVRVPRTINLLLLLAVSCFWFGCNTAAKELIKERVIFRRERDFNLRIGAYYSSKLLVLTMIGVAQATILFGIIRVWCALPGMAVSQWLAVAALATAGAATGLLISAAAQSEEVAVALVPMIVVPQIILAGVIAPLNGLAWPLAKGLITVHWAQQALENTLPKADLTLIGRTTARWSGSLAIVLIHTAVAAALTFIVLSQNERRSRR